MATKEKEQTDLEFFESECQTLIERWGLFDIRFQFETAMTEDAYAEFFYDHAARTILITLSDDLPQEKKTDLIKESAVHEIIEAGILGRLITLGRSRSYDAEEFESEVHSVVYRLQKLLLEEK